MDPCSSPRWPLLGANEFISFNLSQKINWQTCGVRYDGSKTSWCFESKIACLLSKTHLVNWITSVKRMIIGSFKQPWRRRQQKPHKFAYFTMKNSFFARCARAYFIFWHFEDVLNLSTTWNDLFCSCVDYVSIWWQMFNFVFLFSKRWFQFNSRIIRTQFSSIMTLNNWKMIAETRSYIFRWRSRFRRRRVCF